MWVWETRDQLEIDRITRIDIWKSLVNVWINDNNGNNLILEDWAIPITIQDQHTEIIDIKLNRKIDDIVLQANYNIDDRVIRVETTWTTPTTAQTICLKDIDWQSFYQGGILGATLVTWNIYDITLDSPLDFAYTTEDGCSLSSTNMAVDWSTTPIIFKISPFWLSPEVKWDINRVMFWMAWTWVTVSDPQPDDWDFWIQWALTKWILLRARDWIVKNIFNVKTNWELRQRCGWDLTYVPASKNWLYAVHWRRTFNWQEKNWVTIRMTAMEWDELEVIIQDDLTDMTTFEVIAQWQVVSN